MSYFPGDGSGWQVPADYSVRHRSSIRETAAPPRWSDARHRERQPAGVVKTLEILLAVGGLVLGSLQLIHSVLEVGPSPIQVVHDVVFEFPSGFGEDFPEVGPGSFEDDFRKSQEQFDEMVEEEFGDRDRTWPTRPDWADEFEIEGVPAP